MQKKVEQFVTLGGKHCITNSLKQIFTYHGFPMSEEMMLGLASGLSFLYLNQEKSPMVNGRTKVFSFEEKLSGRLGITIKCKSEKSYEKAYTVAKEMIDQNQPVLIYVDMPYLSYLGLDKDSHFGGHAIVLFGYDDKKEQFLISDRDNHDNAIRTPFGSIAEDYHTVSYQELELARSSSYKPFPAKNKYLSIDFSGYKQITADVLSEAITETCENMLFPPAKLLGINGIYKFGKEILKWKNFEPEKLKRSGVTNYFQISKDGGTGGGIFRSMYGIFLTEAASIMKNPTINELGNQFQETAAEWNKIADILWQLSLDTDVSLLPIMSEMILKLYDRETSLYHALQKNI